MPDVFAEAVHSERLETVPHRLHVPTEQPAEPRRWPKRSVARNLVHDCYCAAGIGALHPPWSGPTEALRDVRRKREAGRRFADGWDEHAASNFALDR